MVVKLTASVNPPGVVMVRVAGVNGSVAANNVIGRIVLLVPAGTVIKPWPAMYPALPGVQARIAPAPVVGQGIVAFSG